MASDQDLGPLAADAFVYGFAMVANLEQVARLGREGIGMVPAAPVNTFGHATRLAGPSDKFVSINNDNVYSLANVDVSGGPVRFDVPDAGGRYYVMQFVDPWTNNFAYVGDRATGTKAGSFLLVGPDWDGEAPTDARLIHLPTHIATIVGRWAVDGKADLPAVGQLQQGLRLTPTSAGEGLPEPDPGVPEDLRFFEQLRTGIQAFPPAERDRDYQARFEPLGLFASDSPYKDPDSELAAGLRAGLAQGRQRLEDALKHGAGAKQNGWQLTYHLFDYNLDYFEIGTLDQDEWKLPDTPARYLERAVSARAGLWGNHGYEAAYPMVFVDGDGNALDGSNSYELRFTTTPPCDAFWSLTMYDTPDFYLVSNPIDRYSIGDRTPGLHTATDGSLTIVMQHDEPDEPDRKANWLPTPSSTFRPLLRIYEPHNAVFDGSYELPAITRTN